MSKQSIGYERRSLASKIKLKDMVKNVLKDEPMTRNSDTLLMIRIWVNYYPELIQREGTSGAYVELNNIFHLPKEDSVKRIRAMYQNTDGIYLPTVWEVARRRRIEQDTWKISMGYANPLDKK